MDGYILDSLSLLCLVKMNFHKGESIMEPMLPPRTRTPNPLKKGLKKLTNKIKSMTIMEFLFFVALFPISTVIVISLIKGFNWFYIKTEGIIPTTIVISLIIIIIFIAGFIYTVKHKSKLKEVNKEFDATTILWSCLTGLLTTYIGFSVSLYTSELVKKEEDKEKVAALLDIYVAKYQQEKQEVNNTNAMFGFFDKIVRVIEETGTSNKQEEQPSETDKNNSDNKKIIKIKEPFLSFISQNIDLYSKLSPSLQECIQNWELINDKYNIDLINDGYPRESENPDMSKKLLDQKRAEYLITMEEVSNEISKRSNILELEQQYLRGEISEEVHDNTIERNLAFYTKVNSDLNSIKTVKAFEQYRENYDKNASKIEEEIIKKIENGEGIYYTY